MPKRSRSMLRGMETEQMVMLTNDDADVLGGLGRGVVVLPTGGWRE